MTMNLLKPQPLATPPTSPHTQPKKKSKLYFFIAVVVVLVALLGIRHFTLANWPRDPNATDAFTLRPKKIGLLTTVKNFIFQPDTILEGQEDDRINILLLGMGGPGHDGPYLTDTNIIVSLKPSTHEVAMISIPRDLSVKIPGHGWRRVNMVNHFGEAAAPGSGGEYARKIFAETFNIDIPYYVRVDFQAFKEIIDEVGGVTVDVQRSFVDRSYPGPHDTYQTVSFTAGPELMNGERALIYARSRHGSNGEASDFARARRQQQMLVALKEKLLSFGTYTNPARVQRILDSLSTHISTNLDFSQMMYLAGIGKEVQTTELTTLVLDSSPGGYLVNTIGEAGAFMLMPRGGSFDTVNLAIENIFELTPTSTPVTSTLASDNAPVFPSAKVEIKNGTWRPGFAARMEKSLEEKGFTIIAIGNSLKRPVAVTAIYILNPTTSKEAVNALSKELNTPAGTLLPEWLQERYDDPFTTANEAGPKFSNEADLLVILGENLEE